MKGKVSWEKRRISVVISIYSFAIGLDNSAHNYDSEFLNLFGYAFILFIVYFKSLWVTFEGSFIFLFFIFFKF